MVAAGDHFDNGGEKRKKACSVGPRHLAGGLGEAAPRAVFCQRAPFGASAYRCASSTGPGSVSWPAAARRGFLAAWRAPAQQGSAARPVDRARRLAARMLGDLAARRLGAQQFDGARRLAARLRGDAERVVRWAAAAWRVGVRRSAGPAPPCAAARQDSAACRVAGGWGPASAKCYCEMGRDGSPAWRAAARR